MREAIQSQPELQYHRSHAVSLPHRLAQALVGHRGIDGRQGQISSLGSTAFGRNAPAIGLSGTASRVDNRFLVPAVRICRAVRIRRSNAGRDEQECRAGPEGNWCAGAFGEGAGR
jgi:hypothetical protein